MSTTSNRSNTTSVRSSAKTATPEPPKQTAGRATRSAPDAAKMYLQMNKKELYALSTSSNQWSEWGPVEVRGELVAKGYMDRGAQMSFSEMSHVILRVAAALPGNQAAAADVLHAVEDVGCDVRQILALVREKTTVDDKVAHTLRDAAVQLTNTVEEQAADIRTMTERLNNDIREATERVRRDVLPSQTAPPRQGWLTASARTQRRQRAESNRICAPGIYSA
ncbi:hypothetical protein B0H13DRAFT_2383246 [Mycena leptocephala]|nr:hypothetical protein B0H13DRAFT_2383246 [Mycena leptocephala]